MREPPAAHATRNAAEAGTAPVRIDPAATVTAMTTGLSTKPTALARSASDAYGGYNGRYNPGRHAGAITQALCWAHARRQFFELADIAANARRGKMAPAISPIALEAIKRIDALFDIERGLPAEQRLAIRQEQSLPLLTSLCEASTFRLVLRRSQ